MLATIIQFAVEAVLVRDYWVKKSLGSRAWRPSATHYCYIAT